MAKKKTTKKTRKTRGGTNRGRISKATVSSPQLLSFSPSAGVRLLREKMSVSGPAKEAGIRVAEALTWLEAEYERVQHKAGLRVLLGRPQAASRAQKRPSPAASESESIFTSPQPQVSFIPSPRELVQVMLDAAKITENDIIYDLGSGDGRVVISAAKQYGARGVGIDIDPQRIKEATEIALDEGVADRVSFRQLNLFEADIHDATVVVLYLLPEMNLELRPHLMKQLTPGARVVSHAFDMGDWLPAKMLDVDGSRVYLWIVPDRSTDFTQAV